MREAVAVAVRGYAAATCAPPSWTCSPLLPKPRRSTATRSSSRSTSAPSGAWKPSPGSVYPTIAQLQDEELVEDAPEGRKAIQLTEQGRTYVEEHAEEMAAVWEPFAPEAEDDEQVNFKQVIGQTVGAIVQVLSTGTPDQREKALKILADTRRNLYGILAEGPDESVETDDDGDDGER